MAHFPPQYSDNESKILIAICENPDMSYDTYSLTQLLSGPPARKLNVENRRSYSENGDCIDVDQAIVAECARHVAEHL